MSLERIGRYEIVGELGRGAMGVVYKATDPNIGRTVALKTTRLDGHGLESADLMRRFKNEARAAGLLNHPNIVTIYDAGEYDGIFYIAMECLEGTTLQELLAERRVLEVGEAVRLAQEIAKGLEYAHSHGIVHRDVKPANIMITRNGAVKIMDFGIAKAGGNMTGTGQVLGTPNYMSPEQVKGKSLDGRSDLFSLGVILYEMLTGEKPFSAQNVTTIIYKIVNENPIPPRELDATVPAGLSALVVKCLAKSPDERYQSGTELGRALDEYKRTAAERNVPGAQSLSASVAAPSLDTTVPLPPRTGNGTARIRETNAVAVRPAASARSSKPGRKARGVVGAFAVVLLLGSIAAALVYYRTRAKEHQVQAKISKQALPTIMPQPQPAPASPAPTATPAISPAPDPTATPTPEASIKPISPEPSPEARAWLAGRKQTTPTPVPYSELNITSQPAGAKVSIDGRNDLNWVTPFTASRLKPGNHAVVFMKDGFAQENRSIESLTGKSVSLSVDLTAIFKASITSNPAGATILVDGEDSGLVTPAQLTLEKRQHHITVRKGGYRDASTDTSQAVTFSPILLSNNQASEPGPSPSFLRKFLGSDSIPEGKGLVHVRTVPEGAIIVVDGRVTTKKSNTRWPADPGVYSIELQMPGYKTVHRNIRVEAGKIRNVDEILEQE